MFVKSHTFRPEGRPFRSSHKNRKVEHDNGIFKSILCTMSLETTMYDIDVLIKRASFLTNLFHVNFVLITFHLVCVYLPSVLRIPAKIVYPSLLEAYKHTNVSRAVNKVLQSHERSSLTKHSLPAKTEVWIFYNTSKKNERKTWVKGIVMETHQNYVTCRRNNRGKSMKMAYENIRLVTEGDLTKELQDSIIEDIFESEL